jgi:hypothetical protein
MLGALLRRIVAARRSGRERGGGHKEWATERNHWLFAAGLVAFGALFAVYAVSLKLAELSTVTFGWIITLQVGLLLLERIRYAVVLPNGKWAAIVAILVLQAYLILAPNGEAP